MEEPKFNYFNSLINMSISKHLYLIIFSLLEIEPFISLYIEIPQKLRKYVSQATFNGEDYTIIKIFQKTSFYYIFTKLKRNSNYPIVLLLIFVFFALLFIFLLFFLAFINKKKYNNGISNSNDAFMKIEKILLNFYDHFLFRILAVFLFEIIINYLTNPPSLAYSIIMTILFILFVFIYCFYFTNYRLCAKFSKNQKYIYDDQFMLFCDYNNLFLKIVMCFGYNLLIPSMSIFFIIFAFSELVLVIIKFSMSNCLNTVACVRGTFYIWFLLLFFCILFYENLIQDKPQFFFYFFGSFFFSVFGVLFIRNYKIYYQTIPSIFQSLDKTKLKFELLCEYYDTKYFTYFFKKICFSSNIVYKSNLHNEILNKYLKVIAKQFKYSKDEKNKEQTMFYYIIIKIYRELMTNQTNNFGLMFKTWKILQQFKTTNKVYYINLRFFYQKLCDSSKNNCNFFIYHHSFYNLYKNINDTLTALIDFVKKKNYHDSLDFIKISKLINKFENNSHSDYKIISSNIYKDEFIIIMFRIIIESILNKPINKTFSSIILNEEISSYEELLDKQYNCSHQLIIKLNLNDNSSQIIKIGKNFNKLLGQKIESIFPQKFQNAAKRIFYKEIKNRNRGSTQENVLQSNEKFLFFRREKIPYFAD